MCYCTPSKLTNRFLTEAHFSNFRFTKVLFSRDRDYFLLICFYNQSDVDVSLL